MAHCCFHLNPIIIRTIALFLIHVYSGLLRQWQDMLHLIVKQLQLSENLSKIVGDIKRLEEEVGKVLMGRPPPPVMHNKSDLEKDIEGLKVSKLR